MGIKGFTKGLQKELIIKQLEAIEALDLSLEKKDLKMIKQSLMSSLDEFMDNPKMAKKTRAPSAYNLFMKDKQKDFASDVITVRMKKIANLWGSLSDSDKKSYYDKAAIAKKKLETQAAKNKKTSTAKKPSAKKPTAKKPSAKKPTAKKPSAKKPSAKKRK